MLKSHELFYTVNGKRQVLIVDDEEINRALLGNLLEKDYEVIFAADGNEAMEQIRSNKDTLSAVLLDLIMPEMNGLEVLKQVKSDPQLKNIPIIVVTSDQKSEIESLSLGAADFIPKPYPQPGVILARVFADSLPEYISEVKVFYGDSKNAEKEGITVLKGDNGKPADLNQGAGGGWGSKGDKAVYLGYKTTTDSSVSNTAGSTFTGGTLTLTGGAGLAVGALATAICMTATKKEKQAA